MNELALKDQYNLKANAPEQLIKSLQLMNASPKFRDLAVWDDCEQDKFMILVNSIAFDMGLRTKLHPEEVKRIYEHCKKHFSDINLAEFKEAFSLYHALKLDFKKEFYQSFDLMFTANVLQSFRRYRIEQQKYYEHYKQTTTKIDPMGDFSALLFYWSKSLEKGSYEIPQHITAYYFSRLEQIGIIDFPIDRKKELSEDPDIKRVFIEEKKKTARGFTIEKNKNAWRNHLRSLAFEEWAKEKLKEGFDLLPEIKSKL